MKTRPFRIFCVIFLSGLLPACFDSRPRMERSPVIRGDLSGGRLLIVPVNGAGQFGFYNKKYDAGWGKMYKTDTPTFYGEMIENIKSPTDGKFVIAHIVLHKGWKSIASHEKIPSGPFRIEGTTGLIAVYDSRGKKRMSFKDLSLHHDFSIKTPTVIYALDWHIKKSAFKNKPVSVLEEGIVEIDLKNQKIISKRALSDYFPITEKVIVSSVRGGPVRSDFLYSIHHANGIDYIQNNPVNGNEGLLVTMRKYNGGQVFLLDLKTNKVLWKSAPGQVTFPHDASWTKEKSVTVFDNGKINVVSSRILEIDIIQNKILWEFPDRSKTGGTQNLFNRFRVFSPLISGVQKTEAGYLVTVGMQGKVLEIAKDKSVVFELEAASYFPYRLPNLMPPMLFKVRQYSASD